VNCAQARALMELRRDGTLAADESDALERHVETCADCAEWQVEIPAVLSLLRNAHVPYEPDAALEEKMVASLADAPRLQALNMARHIAVLRAGWIIAAAAAVVLICLYSFRTPAGKVLRGKLADGSDVVSSNTRYRTATTTAVTVGEGARALLEDNVAFSIQNGALHVHEGACYVLSMAGDPARENVAEVVLGGFRIELQAETCMYVHVSARPVVSRNVLEAAGDILAPSAWAADDVMTGDFLAVFSGMALVRVNGHAVSLTTGEMLFVDRPARDPVDIAVFIEQALEELGAEAAAPAALDRQISIYRHVIQSYEAELAAKKRLIGSGDALHPDQLEELKTRQAILEAARTAHRERLGEFLNERAKVPSDDHRKRLEEQLHRVRRAEDGHDEAVSALLTM